MSSRKEYFLKQHYETSFDPILRARREHQLGAIRLSSDFASAMAGQHDLLRFPNIRNGQRLPSPGKLIEQEFVAESYEIMPATEQDIAARAEEEKVRYAVKLALGEHLTQEVRSYGWKNWLGILPHFRNLVSVLNSDSSSVPLKQEARNALLGLALSKK